MIVLYENVRSLYKKVLDKTAYGSIKTATLYS